MVLPTYPDLVTWQPGVIPVSVLRGSVSDGVALLSQRPVLYAQAGTTQSIPNSTDTAVNMTTETYDTWNGHSTTTSPSKYFCQFPGWYLCQSSLPYIYTSATQSLFAGGFNGVNNAAGIGTTYGGLLLCGSTHNPAAQTCDLLPQTLTGGEDFLQPTALQVSGGAVDLQDTAGQQAYVHIRWVAYLVGDTGLPVPANPAWPTPPSYVTSTFLNDNITDALTFLLYPPICKATYVPGTTTLASTSFPAGTVINFNNVAVDNYSGFTTGATGGYTAPVAGCYFCYGQINLAANANATGYCAGFSIAGGTTIWGDVVLKASDAIGGGMTVTKRLRLTAGQKVQLVGCQGSGGAIEYNATEANATRMIVVWEGA